MSEPVIQVQGLTRRFGAKAALDPALQNSMDKLPTVVKNRAMGGPTAGAALTTVMPGLSSPDNTFGVLKDLLDSALRPSQVLVEFHHRFPGLSPADTIQTVRNLRRAGYGLARISSSGREFTFILKSRLGNL